MIERRLIIYQKNISKPIVMTDISDDTDEIVKKNIENIFSASHISTIQTNDDCLIIRPSELSSILISKRPPTEPEQNGKKDSNKQELKLTDSDIKK